jgi:hypothetical protein
MTCVSLRHILQEDISEVLAINVGCLLWFLGFCLCYFIHVTDVDLYRTAAARLFIFPAQCIERSRQQQLQMVLLRGASTKHIIL